MPFFFFTEYEAAYDQLTLTETMGTLVSAAFNSTVLPRWETHTKL